MGLLIYPEQGVAPPLSDDGVYYIQVDTNDAPGASGYFVIRSGKFKFAKSESELSEEDKRWMTGQRAPIGAEPQR
jgi:hypothetical protein